VGTIAYTLSVGGQAVPAAVTEAILKVELEDAVGLADIARIRLRTAVRDDGSGWTLLDDDTFPRLAALKLSISVGDGEPQPLIDGYVVEAQAEFSNEPGGSALSVIALDPSVLMGLEDKARAWPDQPDSDIASAIFGEYSFDSDVEATEPSRQSDDVTTIQRGTDLQFVRALARRNGFEFYVEIDPGSGRPKAHFHPPRLDGEAQGVLSVNMGPSTNVNAFKTRFNMIRPAQAKAKGMDAASREEQSAEVEQPSLRTLGAHSTLSDDRPRKLIVDRTGLSQSGELESYAKAVVDESAWALTAEGELNTVAFGKILRAKRLVAVRGVGRTLSGLYYVERVLHAISDEGYLQRFWLRRTGTGLSGDEDFTGGGAQ
jgi:phage protein D